MIRALPTTASNVANRELKIQHSICVINANVTMLKLLKLFNDRANNKQ